MTKIKICKEDGCNDASTTAGFCRLHYLRHWKAIKDAQREAATRRLNRYIERVLRENPDDYMDVIRKDLKRDDFDEIVGGELDFGEDASSVLGEPNDEAEIEEIIRKLKIEEGF
ncbi:MAG: hypothetical protein ABH871_08385 [Pseudomonadota bacterium]